MTGCEVLNLRCWAALMVWLFAGWDSVSDSVPNHTEGKAERHAADRQAERVYLHKSCQ